MPTGPSSNQYIIPDILLSDTFNEWLTVTNTDIIEKLNFLKVYTASGTLGIGVTTGEDGNALISLATVIDGEHTFTGNITFNGTMTTVNSTEMTVDDYAIVLGHINGGSGGTDTQINTGGGGGIIVKGMTTDKEILWKTNPDAFYVSESVRLGADKRFLSGDDTFRFHTSTGGLSLKVNGSGTTYDSHLYMGTSGGATVGIARIKQDTTVEIFNGVNRKRFHQAGAGFTFGHVVRPVAGGFTLARADSAANAEAVGIIVGVNGNTFDLLFSGEISGDFTTVLGGTFDVGNAYFLSAVTAGYLSANYPATISGNITKPMIVAFGETAGYVLQYVGVSVTAGIEIEGGSATSEGLESLIAGSGFDIGDVVRVDDAGTGYAKADAQSPENSEAIGVITGIVNASTFRMKTFGINQFNGGITLSSAEGYQAGIESGEVYFLSADAGRMTLNQPGSGSSVIKPMMVGLPGNKALILNRNAILPVDSGSGSPTGVIEGMVGKTFIPALDGNSDANLFYIGGTADNPYDNNAFFQVDRNTEDGAGGPCYFLYHLRLAGLGAVPSNATHVVLQGLGQATYTGSSAYSRVIVGPYADYVGLTNSFDPNNVDGVGNDGVIIKYFDMTKYDQFFAEKYCGDFIHNQHPTTGNSTFNEHVVCRIGTEIAGEETHKTISFLVRNKGVSGVDHSVRVVGFYCEPTLSGDVPSTPKNKVTNPFFTKQNYIDFQTLGNASYSNVVNSLDQANKTTIAADGWTVCAVGTSENSITTTIRNRTATDTSNGLDSACSRITNLAFAGSDTLTDAVALFSNTTPNIRAIPDGKATLSFIARVVSGTQKIQAGFSRNYYNNNVNDLTNIPDSSYKHIGTATLTSTWKRYIFTFDTPSISDLGQLNTANLHFILGHKNYSPPSIPSLVNFNNMVNATQADYWATAGTQIEFAHVQLEVGAVGTSIEVLNDDLSDLQTDSIVSMGEGVHSVLAAGTRGVGYTAFRTPMQNCFATTTGGVQRVVLFKSKRGNNLTDPPVSFSANKIEGTGVGSVVNIDEFSNATSTKTNNGFYTSTSTSAAVDGYSFYYLVNATIYPFQRGSAGNLIS